MTFSTEPQPLVYQQSPLNNIPGNVIYAIGPTIGKYINDNNKSFKESLSEQDLKELIPEVEADDDDDDLDDDGEDGHGSHLETVNGFVRVQARHGRRHFYFEDNDGEEEEEDEEEDLDDDDDVMANSRDQEFGSERYFFEPKLEDEDSAEETVEFSPANLMIAGR